jgi:hypothetical protein
MVQKSRREHLIPKLHLKRFARNGHVVVYLKQADALLKSPQGIATTAVRDHAYNVTVTGKHSDALEKALDRGVENHVAPVLDKLETLTLGRLGLSESERASLARYISVLYARVPAMESAFLQAMRETVTKPGWRGLDDRTIETLSDSACYRTTLRK